MRGCQAVAVRGASYRPTVASRLARLFAALAERTVLSRAKSADEQRWRRRHHYHRRRRTPTHT